MLNDSHKLKLVPHKEVKQYDLLRYLCFISFLIFNLACGRKDEAEEEITPQNVYTVKQVTNGGTIEGTVTTTATQFSQTFPVEKDQDICGTIHKNLAAPNGSNVPKAIVYIERLSEGKEWPQHSEAKIDQHGC